MAEAYRLAKAKAQERNPDVIIPSSDQVRYQLNRLNTVDGEVIHTARSFKIINPTDQSNEGDGYCPGKDAGLATGAPGGKKPEATAGPATGAPGEKPKPEKRPGKKRQQDITLEDLKAVDLRGCGIILEAINKIQAETNIKGARLCRVLDLDRNALTRVKSGNEVRVARQAFLKHFPELQLSESGPKLPQKSEMPASAGSKVTLEEMLEVDLSDCKTIPEVIDKFQLETNVTGSRLAEIVEIGKAELSRARQGRVFPYIERAFKAKFPELKIELSNSD